MANFSARNYYDLLGVAHDATPDEIQAAFHKASLEEHPDRSEYSRDIAYERWHWLLEAYETLRDPDRRAEYDEELSHLDSAIPSRREREQRDAREQAERDRNRREAEERRQREQAEREREQRDAREQAERDRNRREAEERRQREQAEREREQRDAREQAERDRNRREAEERRQREQAEREREQQRSDSDNPSRENQETQPRSILAFSALLVGGLKASPFLLLGISSVVWWGSPPDWTLYVITAIIIIPMFYAFSMLLLAFLPGSEPDVPKIKAIGMMFAVCVIFVLLRAATFIPYIGIALIIFGSLVAAWAGANKYRHC